MHNIHHRRRAFSLARLRLAAGLLAIAGAWVTPASASGATPLPGILSYWTGSFVVRPSSIDLTPTDGYIVTGARGTFAHSGPIKWSSWTRFEARGIGVLWVDTCEITCAEGPELRYPATIRGFARQGTHFARLTIDSKYGHSPMQYRMVLQPGFGGKFVPVGSSAGVSAATVGRAAGAECGTVSGSYYVGGSNEPYTTSELRIASVRHINCRGARSVAAKCIADRTVRGWTAHVSRPEPGVIRLTSGDKVIRLEGVAGGGPDCANAAYGAIGL
jgi:hypothetical protein